MTRNHLTLLGLAAAVVVLAADQASKWWVLDVIHLPEVGQIVLLPVLNLTLVRNRGVTFGLLNSFGEWSSLAARRRRPCRGRRPSVSGCAAPNRRWWRSRSAPSSAARSAT